eukprot:4813415-Amphidinium_carterae.1
MSHFWGGRLVGLLVTNSETDIDTRNLLHKLSCMKDRGASSASFTHNGNRLFAVALVRQVFVNGYWPSGQLLLAPLQDYVVVLALEATILSLQDAQFMAAKWVNACNA